VVIALAKFINMNNKALTEKCLCSFVKDIGSQCVSSLLSEIILFLFPCPIELDHLNFLIQTKLLHSSYSVELTSIRHTPFFSSPL